MLLLEFLDIQVQASENLICDTDCRCQPDAAERKPFLEPSYHVTLLTVLATDELGEGFPVAWCISNREIQFVMMNFFQALKSEVGTLPLEWFMSDLSERFYKWWVATFNKPHISWYGHGTWTVHGGRILNSWKTVRYKLQYMTSITSRN